MAQEATDTQRVVDLRRRVRDAMEVAPLGWDCPERIDEIWMSEPLPVRKARAIALELSKMHTDLLLYDLKLIDRELHRRRTGADNRLILSNASRGLRRVRRGVCCRGPAGLGLPRGRQPG